MGPPSNLSGARLTSEAINQASPPMIVEYLSGSLAVSLSSFFPDIIVDQSEIVADSNIHGSYSWFDRGKGSKWRLSGVSV